jgi:uncharacterized membrane protein
MAEEKPDLSLINAPAEIRATPDAKSKEEWSENRKQNIGLRRFFARTIFGLVVLWLVLVYVMLFFQGFSFHGFHLSDSVLIAAIGSTTANVIALLVIVLKYLFGGSE